MQVGTTKDQGLYNKPSAAVHRGALAAGILPQCDIIQPLLQFHFYADVCFTSPPRIANFDPCGW